MSTLVIALLSVGLALTAVGVAATVLLTRPSRVVALLSEQLRLQAEIDVVTGAAIADMRRAVRQRSAASNGADVVDI